MTNHERQALTGGMVGIHLSIGPLVNYFGSASSPWENLLDYGLLAGQVSILGIWTVYSRLSINRRVCPALAGLAYVWFWMVRYWALPASHALGVLAQWTIVVGLLIGWRTLFCGREEFSAERQFRLRELLLWTAMAGAALTLAKRLGADPSRELGQFDRGTLLAMGVSIASYALVGVVGLWIAGTSRHRVLKAFLLPILAVLGTASVLRLQNPVDAARYSVPMLVSGLLVACTVAMARWLESNGTRSNLTSPLWA